MFRVVVAALVAVFLCLPVAACDQFDHVVSLFAGANAKIHIFTPEELPAVVAALADSSDKDVSGATRAFVVALSTKVIVGLEVDGCLLAPVTIATPKSAPLSGRSRDGRIGA